MTDSLLLSAFILRVAGIASAGQANPTLRLRSFQCLSFVAPLIWYVFRLVLCYRRWNSTIG